jgi:geranylgeranyl diphosphate synthase type I
VAESTRLVDVVQERIDRFLERQRPALAGIAPDLDPFSLYSGDLLRGGKRFRALFCYWGWQSVAGLDTGFDPLGEARDEREIDAVMTASAGLEFFHAAALVHDDIMDNSPQRTGASRPCTATAPGSVPRRPSAGRAPFSWATCCWRGATSC